MLHGENQNPRQFYTTAHLLKYFPAMSLWPLNTGRVAVQRHHPTCSVRTLITGVHPRKDNLDDKDSSNPCEEKRDIEKKITKFVRKSDHCRRLSRFVCLFFGPGGLSSLPIIYYKD